MHRYHVIKLNGAMQDGEHTKSHSQRIGDRR